MPGENRVRNPGLAVGTGGVVHLFRAFLIARSRRKAEADRQTALDALSAAFRAKDTRAIHAAQPHAVRATCAALAAEIGRSPSSWRGR